MTTPRSITPRVAIGMPVHNGGMYLRQALDALLAQTFSDFQVLIFDDGSTDSSDEIIREYVAKDSRLHHVRLERRAGMVEAWRQVARLARERFQPDFFAWHSDHDWVAPDWLHHLYATITRHEGAALVHARTVLVDRKGRKTGEMSEFMDTAGLPLLQRLEKAIFSTMGAGDAVYGLFRWNVLDEHGIFHDEIMPDRLLVTEANLYGEVFQAEQAVRFRRQTAARRKQVDIIARQLKTLFPEGYVKQNPFVSHATFFLRRAHAKPTSGNVALDLARLYLGFIYYQRSLRKFQEPLEQELADVGQAATLLLAQAVTDKKIRLVSTALAAACSAPSEADSKFAALRASLRKVRRVKAHLEGELAGVQHSLHALSEKLQTTAAARSIAEAELARQRGHIQTLEQAKATLANDLVEARSSLEAARAEITAISARLECIAAARSAAESDLTLQRMHLQEAHDAKAALENTLAESQRSLEAEEKKRSALERELVDTRDLVESAQVESRTASKAARDAAAALENALVQSQRSLEAEKAKRGALERELVDVRYSLDSAQLEAQTLSENVTALKQSRRELDRRYRRVRILGVFGFAGLKIADRVQAIRNGRKLSSVPD